MTKNKNEINLGKDGKAELARLTELVGERADPKVLQTTASVYEEMQEAKKELEEEGRTVVMIKGGVAHTLNAPAYKRWYDSTKTYRQLMADLDLLKPKPEPKKKRGYV